jgi:hypothetical protein
MFDAFFRPLQPNKSYGRIQPKMAWLLFDTCPAFAYGWIACSIYCTRAPFLKNDQSPLGK